MPVFNAYFKIIKKSLPALCIYFFVFTALSVLMTSLLGAGSATAFTETKSNIALYNEDAGAPLADGLETYIAQKANIIDIQDDAQSLQDALFYGKIDGVLRVPAGFSDSFMRGGDAKIEKTMSASTTNSVFLDVLVDKYLDSAKLYAMNLPSASQANIVKNTEADLGKEAEVTLNTYGAPNGAKDLTYNFQFFAYPIIAILIWGMTSIMMTIGARDFSNRTLCSPIRPLRLNMQILLGNAVFALVTWAALMVVILVMQGGMPLDTSTLFLILNSLAFTFVSLSLGFLTGRLVRSQAAQAAVTNVLSLGMCFLSGVFVEQALLGKTVLSIASFTPGYWYIRAVEDIRATVAWNAQNIQPVVYSMLIQLGFATAILVIALAITKQRKKSLA